jgi:hypothetical protein
MVFLAKLRNKISAVIEKACKLLYSDFPKIKELKAILEKTNADTIISGLQTFQGIEDLKPYPDIISMLSSLIFLLQEVKQGSAYISIFEYKVMNFRPLLPIILAAYSADLKVQNKTLPNLASACGELCLPVPGNLPIAAALGASMSEAITPVSQPTASNNNVATARHLFT